eukprot:TRINITY_DN170_c0_g1_i5.p1 TRINITY_DN170_c0_g1~~TRINITY_DN170_c0_g1_i5.p1  ORF type:complete len:201 (-),score=46.84 TRINITY_DN170_c0_g1_i5:47-649(-)
MCIRDRWYQRRVHGERIVCLYSGMYYSLPKTRESKLSGTQQCQRCLKYGHFTYECKNDVAYLYRPSRTMQFKEKALRQPLNTDKPPPIPKITDGDKFRTVKKDEPEEEDEDEDEVSSEDGDNEKKAGAKESDSDSDSESSDEESEEEEEKPRGRGKDRGKEFFKVVDQKSLKRDRSRSREKERVSHRDRDRDRGSKSKRS